MPLIAPTNPARIDTANNNIGCTSTYSFTHHKRLTMLVTIYSNA
jgi:hypothetical protein